MVEKYRKLYSMFGFTSEALNASADVYLRRGKIESIYHDHSYSADTLIHTYKEYDCRSVLIYGKFCNMEKILQKYVICNAICACLLQYE